jgi:hypothetical protein
MEFKNQLLFLRKGNLNFENYYYENLEKTLTNYFILVSKSHFKNVFLKNLDIFADIHLQFQKKEKPRVDLSVGFEYSLVFKEIAEIFSGFIN